MKSELGLEAASRRTRNVAEEIGGGTRVCGGGREKRKGGDNGEKDG